MSYIFVGYFRSMQNLRVSKHRCVKKLVRLHLNALHKNDGTEGGAIQADFTSEMTDCANADNGYANDYNASLLHLEQSSSLPAVNPPYESDSNSESDTDWLVWSGEECVSDDDDPSMPAVQNFMDARLAEEDNACVLNILCKR